MPIAEAIGTAIGEAIGRVQKFITEDVVDMMLEMMTSDSSGGRQKRLSFADSANGAKKSLYEEEMLRRSMAVEQSCLKARNLHVDSDAIVNAGNPFSVIREIRKQSAVTGQAHKQNILDENKANNIVTALADSILNSTKPIITDVEMESAKLELNTMLANLDDMAVCTRFAGSVVDDGTCTVSMPENPSKELVMKQSKKLTMQARVNLVREILSQQMAMRYRAGGQPSQMELLAGQVKSVKPGGVLNDELNLTAGDDTPILKEVIGNQMIMNQLYIQLIFEEETRLALAALNVLLGTEFTERA
jgi:hypothetical protein